MKPRSSLYCESSSSSSSDDDEGACAKGGKAGSSDKLESIPCTYSRCDQEILCINGSEHYCSRDCYYGKLERDLIGGETGIQLKRITINGRGGTGLLRDRNLLDNLIIQVDSVLGRVVSVCNSGAAASRWKKRGQAIKVSSRKTDEGKQNSEEKQKLKALLNFGGSDNSSEEEESTTRDDNSNDDKKVREVTEEAEEEIQTMLSSGVNSSICPVHPPVEKRDSLLKGYIIGIKSPWELYVQTEQMVIETDSINEICNRPEGIDPRSVLPLWLPQVGGYCAAKYEGKLYRAKILERLGGASSFRVKYMDYGNIDTVLGSDVFQLNPEVTLIPRQYFFFKISNVKPRNGEKKWGREVCEFLMEHLDGGIVDIEVDSVERGAIHWGRASVLSSLSGKIQGDLGRILVEKKMADPDSFYL